MKVRFGRCQIFLGRRKDESLPFVLLRHLRPRSFVVVAAKAAEQLRLPWKEHQIQSIRTECQNPLHHPSPPPRIFPTKSSTFSSSPPVTRRSPHLTLILSIRHNRTLSYWAKHQSSPSNSRETLSVKTTSRKSTYSRIWRVPKASSRLERSCSVDPRHRSEIRRTDFPQLAACCKSAQTRFGGFLIRSSSHHLSPSSCCIQRLCLISCSTVGSHLCEYFIPIAQHRHTIISPYSYTSNLYHHLRTTPSNRFDQSRRLPPSQTSQFKLRIPERTSGAAETRGGRIVLPGRPEVEEF